MGLDLPLNVHKSDGSVMGWDEYYIAVSVADAIGSGHDEHDYHQAKEIAKAVEQRVSDRYGREDITGNQIRDEVVHVMTNHPDPDIVAAGCCYRDYQHDPDDMVYMEGGWWSTDNGKEHIYLGVDDEGNLTPPPRNPKEETDNE